jgi:hypothetical protein
MKTIITVRTEFDSEEEADTFVDAISNLDDEGMFPTGAAVQRDFDYEWVEVTCNDCKVVHRHRKLNEGGVAGASPVWLGL